MKRMLGPSDLLQRKELTVALFDVAMRKANE